MPGRIQGVWYRALACDADGHESGALTRGWVTVASKVGDVHNTMEACAAGVWRDAGVPPARATQHRPLLLAHLRLRHRRPLGGGHAGAGPHSASGDPAWMHITSSIVSLVPQVFV